MSAGDKAVAILVAAGHDEATVRAMPAYDMLQLCWAEQRAASAKVGPLTHAMLARS